MITETTRRAKSSRIASILKKEFSDSNVDIHVSENAPCHTAKYKTNPADAGWVEIEKKDNWVETVRHAMIEHEASEIHIKNATLGGKSRVWVRIDEC